MAHLYSLARFSWLPRRLAAVAFAGMIAGAAAAVADEPVYFLVAEQEAVPLPFRQNDSSVLPLVRTNDFQQARQQVNGENVHPIIVFAEIAAGAGGINRDYLTGRSKTVAALDERRSRV